MIECSFECCDFTDPDHLNALASLLNHYMTDPMGEHAPHNKIQQLRLVDGLANHPSTLIFFVKVENVLAGMIIGFINFSTFNIKPYLNIHDLIVLKEFRGKGLGKALLEESIRLSKEKDFCKITLEVREDNEVAKRLYNNLNFEECEPVMLFWTKNL